MQEYYGGTAAHFQARTSTPLEDSINSYSIASGWQRFRSYWKAYVFQSTLGGLTSFLVLLFLSIEEAVLIAALGASAFIVFARPFDLTARPQNVTGGHLIGFTVGCLCALIPHDGTIFALACHALAVGLSIFVMVVVNMQHPPAAATALGMAVRGFSEPALAAIITITLILALAHVILRPHLRNLF
ncbi:MAG TPA: HPP family protein [Dehalococcoidia bacterium]|nr:HPP family protein [Dehalococcoidia bacterium]